MLAAGLVATLFVYYGTLIEYFFDSWVQLAMFCVSFVMVWLPPVQMGFHGVAYCVITLMAEQFGKLSTELKTSPESKEEEEVLAEGEGKVERGLTAVEATKMADEALGGMLLTEIGTCFFAETMQIFFLSSGYRILSNYNDSHVLIFACNLFALVLAYMRKCNLYWRGQRLADQMRECKDTIQEYRIRIKKCLATDTSRAQCLRYKLGVLEEELGRSEPIRPRGVFALNLETMVGGLGLLLTYSLVLIQFKMSEFSQPSTTMFEEEGLFANASDST